MFPDHHTPEGSARLARDHGQLREGIEALAQAAAGEGTCSHVQLAASPQDVLAQRRDRKPATSAPAAPRTG